MWNGDDDLDSKGNSLGLVKNTDFAVTNPSAFQHKIYDTVDRVPLHSINKTKYETFIINLLFPSMALDMFILVYNTIFS